MLLGNYSGNLKGERLSPENISSQFLFSFFLGNHFVSFSLRTDKSELLVQK